MAKIEIDRECRVPSCKARIHVGAIVCVPHADLIPSELCRDYMRAWATGSTDEYLAAVAAIDEWCESLTEDVA